MHTARTGIWAIRTLTASLAGSDCRRREPTNPFIKAFTPSLVAGLFVVSMTACSKDLPSGPADDSGAGTRQTEVTAAVVPTNDDFEAAVTVTEPLPFTHSVNTAEATPAEDDPPDQCAATGATVWYQFTPTADMRVEANTFGSNFDTGIAVYTGTPGDLTEVTCNDDSQGASSRVRFDATANVTYFFKVGAFAGGTGGDLTFNVNVAPPALEADLTLNPTGIVNSRTGVAMVGGTVTCSEPAFVDIFGELSQRIGRRATVTAQFYVFVECDGVTEWQAEVVPFNGRLAGGKAETSVSATFFAPVSEEFASDSESTTLRLIGNAK